MTESEMTARIAALEAAIRDANEWCKVAEGVPLVYFLADWYAADSDAESRRLIKELCGE